MKLFILSALPFLLLAGCQVAQKEAGVPKTGEVDTGKVVETANSAQTAYAAANATMHQGMAKIDADPDVAFMQGMVAHHKGAVAMSEVALKYGKDAKVRDLANRIIKAQAGEIAEMEAWLAEHGAEVTPAKDAAPAMSHEGH